MKKLIYTIVYICFAWQAFSQNEVIKFEYSPNGERLKREVIVLGGKDQNKSEETYIFEANDKTIKIYPNPVLNYLSIEMIGDYSENKYQYQVYSSNGTQVLTGEIIDGQNISFKPLAPGTYFLTMFIDNSKKTWKIIKK